MLSVCFVHLSSLSGRGHIVVAPHPGRSMAILQPTVSCSDDQRKGIPLHSQPDILLVTDLLRGDTDVPRAAGRQKKENDVCEIAVVLPLLLRSLLAAFADVSSTRERRARPVPRRADESEAHSVACSGTFDDVVESPPTEVRHLVHGLNCSRTEEGE